MAVKTLSKKEQDALLSILKLRFEDNPRRHEKLKWKVVETKLLNNPGKLWSLQQMETSGGEPDVVGIDDHSSGILFIDCSAESPKGRRSCCYDQEALKSRKDHPPKYSAVGMAEAMGIQLLTEDQYRSLQQLGPFDTKTSSWLMAPPELRKLGGAIFGDYRFGRVFTYHNGPQSYYAGRAFRGVLHVP